MLQQILRILILSLFFAKSVAAQVLPTAGEIERSINSIRVAKSQAGGIKVTAVEGCYPTDQKQTLLCLVRGGNGSEISVQELAVRNTGGKWNVIEPGENPISALCPSNAEATRLLRELKKRTDIQVVGEADDGHGTFSDERGMSREQKGPLRLMCRFNVNDSSGSDRLYLSYVGYSNGKYTIDPDVEVWD